MTTRFELVTELRASTWKEDRYGHFVVTHNDKKYRLKIQAMSVRFEKQALIAGKNEWLRVISDYYKNITVGEREGKRVIRIGNRALPL